MDQLVQSLGMTWVALGGWLGGLGGTGWLVLGRVSVTQIQSDEKRSDSMSSFTSGKLVNNHLKERNDKIQHYIGYVLYLQLSLRLRVFCYKTTLP